MIDLLEDLLGAPVVLEDLKHKPGRRSTWRAVGRHGRAIVKRYESDRAPSVAARVAALGAGPAEPIVPQVLALDTDLHVIVLSEVPGVPFRAAVLGGDLAACGRVGAALARWHTAWAGARPPGFRVHTADREIDLLLGWAEATPGQLGEAVRASAQTLGGQWESSTVVHRDLYEEQVLLGERVGIIDLDDAAIGPPELDLGNLVAHLALLGIRARHDLTLATGALLQGYLSVAWADPALLARLRRLSLLRLACIHHEPILVGLASADPAGRPPVMASAFLRAERPCLF